MLLGKTEKSTHDSFLQAAHRVAGKYPIYQSLENGPPLLLWANTATIDFFRNSMMLHEEIIDLSSQGRTPFLDDATTFNYGGSCKPKLTKPAVQSALWVKHADKSRIDTFWYFCAAGDGDVWRPRQVVRRSAGQAYGNGY